MEETTKSVREKIVINSDLDIVTARLHAREIAREMGFGTIDQARISLAASELARILTTNVAASGEILISGVNTADHVGIQVTSVDPSPAAAIEQVQAEDSALTHAMSLVDESIVEQDGRQNTRITLMKWLS